MSEEPSIWKRLNGVYTAHLLLETNEGFKHLSEDEDLAYTVYFAEKRRKKPGFLRRTGEKIECISRIHYPLLVKRFRENYVFVFDPRKKNRLEVKYGAIDRDALDKLVEEISSMRGKEFLDRLVSLEKKFKNMTEYRELVKMKTAAVEHLISDNELLDELKTILNRKVEYTHPGVKMAINDIPVEEYLNILNTIVDEIAEIIGYLNSLVSKLSRIIEDWKADVSAEYGEKIREIDSRLQALRKEVMQRIEELKAKRDEEIRAKRERERPILENIENKITELRKKLDELRREYEKAREYGGDAKGIKKKIGELEKQLREFENKRDEVRAKLEQEIEELVKKYDEMMESEKNRIKELEDERKRLDEELESIIRQGDDRFNHIRDKIYEYIEKLKIEQKRIMDSAIPMPTGGEGLYWITVYVIMYSRHGEPVKPVIVPPLYVKPPGKLIRHAKVEFFESLRAYLEDLMREAEEKYGEWVEELNILRKVSLERIEIGLTMLAEKGVINRKEIHDIVTSLKKQLI